MVYTDIFFLTGRKYLCRSIRHLYIYYWDILYMVFTHLYRYCFGETRISHKKLESCVFLWPVEYMTRACSSLEKDESNCNWKDIERHYLIPEGIQCFLVVIYNPWFPLVDQRHKMWFWPIVCFLEPAGMASFRMVTPYAFKVFNLYYHNEIPWLSKSLWQFTGAKQKVVFICVASPHAHASEHAFSRMLNSFFCVYLSQQLTPAQPIEGVMASFKSAHLCKTE